MLSRSFCKVLPWQNWDMDNGIIMPLCIHRRHCAACYMWWGDNDNQQIATLLPGNGLEQGFEHVRCGVVFRREVN